MKKTLFKHLISVVLILAISLTTLTVYAVDGGRATDEIPYSAPNGTFLSNYAGALTAYSAEEAATAGVPLGYSGYVIKVTPGSDGAYAGYDYDFSSQNIPVNSIESITFRVYLPTGNSEMRLVGELAPSSWVMRAAPAQLGAWCDLTLSSDGTNFQSGKSMASLANSEGNLGRFCLIAKLGSSQDKSYYLDSITVKYKEGTTSDTTPPVISYSGATSLSFKVGDLFSLDGLSAYDEYDNAAAALSYVWSDGAVNGDGSLNVGNHTCTVIATDRSGNESSITLAVHVEADRSVVILDTIPYTDFVAGVSIYDGTVEQLTADEAAAQNVPAGYKDGVLKISGSAARFGMTFDPRSLNLPVEMIESMTIRIFLYQDSNAFRLSNHADTDWVSLQDATASTWMEYKLSADGTGFSNGYKMNQLADESGNLGIFGIATNDKTGNNVFYIDSIVINLKKDNGEAPVITYNGETDILTSSGKPLALDISVHDSLLGDNIALVYDFSEGALDNDGNLIEGSHTCRVSATNYYGYTSYIDLNLTVGPPDVTPPEILFTAQHVYLPTGAIYSANILAIDDYDKVVVEEKWSKNAVDLGGRFNKGEHTLTLTVTDLTGNKTVMVVYFHITDDDPVQGQLIVCGNNA